MTNEEALIRLVAPDISHLAARRPGLRAALNIAIVALEKQIPKKVTTIESFWNTNGKTIKLGYCPRCGKMIGSETNPKGCPYCVSAIDWSDKE